MARQILAEVILRLRAQDGISGPSLQVAGALKQAENAARGLAAAGKGLDGWGSGFQRSIDRLRVSAKDLEAIRAEYRKLNAELKAMGDVSPTMRAQALASWRTQTVANLLAVQHQANATTRSLQAIGQATVRSVRHAAGIGVGAYAGGRATREGVTAGSEQLRQGARDYLGGLSTQDSARLAAAGFAASSRRQSINAATMHELLRETAQTMGGSNGGVARAISIQDDLARTMTVLQSMKGREQALRELTGFMRGLDTLGRVDDPARVAGLLNGMTRAAGVEGRELNFRDLFLVAKRSKSFGASAFDDFMFTALPPLIADMGADRVGTALGSMVPQTVGNRATRPALSEQRRLGLRDARGRFLHGPEILSNPFTYARDRLAPALRADGVDLNDNAAVTAAISKLFSNQMVADLFTKMITQMDQYQKRIAQYERAPGNQAADQLPQRDPFVAWTGVQEQLRNAAAEVAKPLLETVIPGLNGLAGVLNKLAGWMRENPQLAPWAAGGLGAAGMATAGAASWLALRGVGSALGLGGAATAGGIAGGAAGVGGGLLRAIPGLGTAASAIHGLYSARQAIGKTFEGVSDGEQHDFGRRMRREAERRARQGRDEQFGPMGENTTGGGFGSDMRGAFTEFGNSARQAGQEAGQTLGQGVTRGAQSQTGAAQAAGAAIGATIVDALRAAAARAGSTGGGGGGGSTPDAPGRSLGGPVTAGRLYSVGEAGEELFRPNESGTIIPHHARIGSAGRSIRGPAIGSVTINGVSAEDVMAQLTAKLREGMDGLFADA